MCDGGDKRLDFAGDPRADHDPDAGIFKRNFYHCGIGRDFIVRDRLPPSNSDMFMIPRPLGG